MDFDKIRQYRNTGLEYMMKLYISVKKDVHYNSLLLTYERYYYFQYDLMDVSEILDNDNTVCENEEDYPFV